jgi:dihydroorotate dehydrogenase electron transfer subunit
MNSASAPGSACAALKVLDLKSSKDYRFHTLKLASPGWSWTPGQFVMVRPVHWDHDPLGGRPLSIGDLDDEALHLYFQVVGKGTSLLARLRPGDEVLVWGPLGRGFEVNFNVPTMLLAGGMGIVPFVGLSRIHPRPENIEILFGHQYELHNYPFQGIEKRILAWNIQDRTAKDLEKMKRALEIKIKGYSPDGSILACGPRPFLHKVQAESAKFGARTQVSLETAMACGVGACLGCSVLTASGGYLQACQDGPVFWSSDIVLSDTGEESP